MAILELSGEGKSKIQIGPILLFTFVIEFLLQNILIWAISSKKWEKQDHSEEILILHPLLYGLPIVIRLEHVEKSTGK